MDDFLIDEVLLDDELLCYAEHVTKGVIESKRRSHFVEHAHKDDRKNKGHILHHRIVGILRGHVTVVYGQEEAGSGHEQCKEAHVVAIPRNGKTEVGYTVVGREVIAPEEVLLAELYERREHVVHGQQYGQLKDHGQATT